MTFDDLAASRREWIANVLKSWCSQASLVELRQAEHEWHDLAGRVAPEKTLWPWAWSRFPELVHDSLGIDETSEVRVVLIDGRSLRGFPDSRASQRGSLVLWGIDSNDQTPHELGPFTIEQVAAVSRIAQ